MSAPITPLPSCTHEVTLHGRCIHCGAYPPVVEPRPVAPPEGQRGEPVAWITEDAFDDLRDWRGQPGGHVGRRCAIVCAEQGPRATIPLFDHQAPAEGAGWVRVPRDRLQAVSTALDNALGDTDPYIDDEMTDDDVRQSEPAFWACQQVNAMLAATPTAPEPVGLPELPDSFARVCNDGYWCLRVRGTEKFQYYDSRCGVTNPAQDVYTADQLRAYGDACRAAPVVVGDPSVVDVLQQIVAATQKLEHGSCDDCYTAACIANGALARAGEQVSPIVRNPAYITREPYNRARCTCCPGSDVCAASQRGDE